MGDRHYSGYPLTEKHFMLPKILAGTIIIVMSTSAAVHGSERLLAQIVPNLRQSSLEWKNREKAYEKARLGKQLDRARELHQVGFLAIDTWLANNKPTWLTSEANTKLREKAISIYIAESNAEFLRAFQAIDAGDWFNIGRIAFTMKKYSTAAMMFGMASKLRGGFSDSDFWRAKALASLYFTQTNETNAKIALTAYNALISANPTYYLAYYDRAELLSLMDKIEESISDYKMAIAHNVRKADAHVALGVLMRRISDTAAAERHFRQALYIDPQNQLAKEGLASLRQGGQAYTQTEENTGLGSIDWQKRQEEDRIRSNEYTRKNYNLIECGNQYGINCPF